MTLRAVGCAAALLVIGAALSGCGYHTAGHAVQLPSDVHSIAVPAFVNKTRAYRVEQVLDAAVVREFTTRTTYHIENSADPQADAILRATVIEASTAPFTYDSTTGRASSGLVTLRIAVTFKDRNGKVLFEDPNYTFREQYEISGELSSFFDEETPAVDRMSRDFARTLVSNLLEGF